MVDRIKQYRIERKIGSGGMATVYEAVDTHNHTRVAIKVLHPHLSDQPTYVERFLREARMAMALHNPHIVQVLGSGRDRDRYYMVMEYVSGVTLQQFITQQQGVISVVQALGIAYQVGRALEEANRHGIVHRDIKPQNIMITPSGMIKVMDFGVARDVLMDSMTMTGMFVGTPQYSSPEQAAGEPIDTRSDIYSLGVVLYQLLTGTVPFRADTPQALLLRVMQGNPVPVQSLRVDLPTQISNIVNRMLQRDPERRFRSPTELCDALRPLLGSDFESAHTEMATIVAPLISKSTPLPRPIPGPRRMLYGGLGGAAALVAVVLIMVVWQPWGTHVRSIARQQATPTQTAILPTLSNPSALPVALTNSLAPSKAPASPSTSSETLTSMTTPLPVTSTSTPTPLVTLASLVTLTETSVSTSSPSVTPTNTLLPPTAKPTTIPVKLTAPALVGPPDGATQTGSVKLQWQPVDGAASYNVETRSDRPGQTEWRAWPTGATTVLTIAFDEHPDYFHDPGTVYYWRVTALYAQGQLGDISRVQRFVFQRHEVKPIDTPKPEPPTPVPPPTEKPEPPTPPPVSGAFVNRRDIEMTDGQLALMLCVVGLMVLPLRKRS